MVRFSLFIWLVSLFFLVAVNGQDNFEPMVAFMCNHPSMHLSEKSREWVKDDGTECLKDPTEVLNYCKKVYPKLDVRNVVEGSQPITISNWCGFGVSKKCKRQFTVTPFRCLVGAFQSDALLVPDRCVFDHIHDSKLCTSYSDWNATAQQSCRDRSMVARSFAILQPCGTDRFTGVEFVCCPPAAAAAKNNNENVAKSSDESSSSIEVEKVGSTNQKSVGRKEEKEPDSITQYVNQAAAGQEDWNEHDYYMKAKEDMQKHQQRKITKLMKDWASARERVEDLKAIDPTRSEKLNKEITERYQKQYEAAQAEGVMEKNQLTTLHQQRVQADLNERKDRALDNFVEAIDDDDTDSGEILQSLRRYVKALQKDRFHSVQRYKHLLDTDPAQADSTRAQTADHLRGLDHQLTNALAMLNRVPKYKNKILPQIQPSLDAYHSIDRSVSALMLGLADKPATTTTAAPDTDDYEIEEEEEEYDDIDEEQNEADRKAVEDMISKGDFENEPAATKSVVTSKETAKAGSDDEDEGEDEEEEKKEQVEDDDSKNDDEENKKVDEVPATMTMTVGASSLKSTASDEDSIDKEEDEENEEVVDDDADRDDVVVDYLTQKKLPQLPNFIGSDDLAVHQSLIEKPLSLRSSAGFGAALPLGIAVGAITVLVVILVGVVVMRSRARRAHARGKAQRCAELEAMTSPEECHVREIQANGYVNPTYQYFEQNNAVA